MNTEENTLEPNGDPIIVIEYDLMENQEVVLVEPRTLRIQPKVFCHYDDAYEYASALSEATGYVVINQDELWKVRPAVTVGYSFQS